MISQKYIVMFSGGIGSFYTAKRLVDKYGPNNVLALFADTLIEDEDLYRFLHESVEYLNIELVIIKDGRDVWQVFKDVKFLGNSRIDPCSKILKRELLKKWQSDNLDPSFHVICYGIDWTEIHRFERLVKREKERGFQFELQAPLCEKPLVTKVEMLEDLKEKAIKPPRLYEMGFPHNNCGGFCVKAGQAQFALLYEKFPERYKYHEAKEQEMRELLGKDVTIIVRQRNKKKERVSLKQFREEIDCQKKLFDEDEFGGCGCAID